MHDNHFAQVQEEIMLGIEQNRMYKTPTSTKQFQIVQGRVDEVEREVQLLLTQGWVCQGGIALYQDWFGQAMMRDVYEQHQIN